MKITYPYDDVRCRFWDRFGSRFGGKFGGRFWDRFRYMFVDQDEVAK